jgi:prepilin peptidase dependent protein B
MLKLKHNKQVGFTLIELLLASALGVIVLGGILSVFATTVKFNADNLQMMRLNQELRGVMSLISRDLRRAGYFNSVTSTATYVDVFGGADTGTYGYNDCVYFAYDIDADGAVEDSDFVAYKLQASEIRQGTGNSATAATFNCTTEVAWQSITEYDAARDRSDVQITRLEFIPECTIGDGAVLPDTFTCGGGGDISVRNIEVTITGQITTGETVTRTLTETIKLRNNVSN